MLNHEKGDPVDSFSVLIVDDEVEFMETLVKRMRRRKVDAYGAVSGEQVLAHLSVKGGDVAVLDVRMPEMDGIEILRAVPAHQGDRRLRALRADLAHHLEAVNIR